MTWAEELSHMQAEAAGDLAVYVALAALRKVENGAPGREWGVLSVPAPTYADQCHVAANSLRHRAREFYNTHGGLRGAETGLFTASFLNWFSGIWAPLDAQNDPNHLNVNHARLLVRIANVFGRQALEALGRLTYPVHEGSDVPGCS